MKRERKKLEVGDFAFFKGRRRGGRLGSFSILWCQSPVRSVRIGLILGRFG